MRRVRERLGASRGRPDRAARPTICSQAFGSPLLGSREPVAITFYKQLIRLTRAERKFVESLTLHIRAVFRPL